MFDSINFSGFADNMPNNLYKTKHNSFQDRYNLGNIKIIKTLSNNKIIGTGSLTAYYNGGANYPIISVSEAIEAAGRLCDFIKIDPDQIYLNWFDITLDILTPNSYIDIHNIYIDSKTKRDYYRSAPDKGGLLTSYFKIDKSTMLKIYDLKSKAKQDLTGVRIETTLQKNIIIKTLADITPENTTIIKDYLQDKIYNNLRYKPPELTINPDQNNFYNMNVFKRYLILKQLAQYNELEFNFFCSNLAANNVNRSSINRLIADRNEALKKINLVVPVNLKELVTKQNYK
jgi:hypothetical protein